MYQGEGGRERGREGEGGREREEGREREGERERERGGGRERERGGRGGGREYYSVTSCLFIGKVQSMVIKMR